MQQITYVQSETFFFMTPMHPFVVVWFSLSDQRATLIQRFLIFYDFFRIKSPITKIDNCTFGVFF